MRPSPSMSRHRSSSFFDFASNAKASGPADLNAVRSRLTEIRRHEPTGACCSHDETLGCGAEKKSRWMAKQTLGENDPPQLASILALFLPYVCSPAYNRN